MQMNHSDKAAALFSQRFHCSQAVLAAFAEELGLTEEQALRLGGSFGGGMCKGEVCGACTGALMVIGLKYGQSVPGDEAAKQICSQKTVQFLNAFEAKHGSYLCRKLIGYNLASDMEREAARAAGVFVRICPQMIRTAVELTETLLGKED